MHIESWAKDAAAEIRQWSNLNMGDEFYMMLAKGLQTARDKAVEDMEIRLALKQEVEL